MSDKKMMFLAVNMLITVVSLAIIIGTMFIENQKTKLVATAIAIVILIIQKSCRNNCYKRDKEGKYSSIDYYSYRCWLFWIQNFLIKGELMLFTLAPNLKNILS